VDGSSTGTEVPWIWVLFKAPTVRRSHTCKRSRQLVSIKPKECLEYILVHEMLHLLEPTHNERFMALMDQFMPKWQSHRDALNRLPVRHESWDY